MREGGRRAIDRDEETDKIQQSGGREAGRNINRSLIPFGSQKYVELGRLVSGIGPWVWGPRELIRRTIILRAPFALSLLRTLLSLALSWPVAFGTECISRGATSTDALQDKWPRDGGYITFQNSPNRRLSG